MPISPYLALGPIATIQAISAVSHFWSVYKNWSKWRAEKNAPYAKVLQGETRLGWSMILPRRLMRPDENIMRNRVVPLSWANDDDPNVATALESTVLIRSVSPTPDGRRIATLRRYSLVRPDMVYANLSRVVYDSREWSHQLTSYLNSTSIGTVFRKKDTNQFRLIVSHAFRRAPVRTFDLESPIPDADVHLIYDDPSRKRFRIVFGRWLDQDPEDDLADEDTISRFELCNAAYSLRGGVENAENVDVINKAISSDGISVVTGGRDVSLSIPTSRQDMTVFVYNAQESSPVSQNICITFGRQDDWRVENMTHWLRSAQMEYKRGKDGKW